MEFNPRALDSGRSRGPSAMATSPRSRAQHTFAGAGESLFPAPSPDGKHLYFASSSQGAGFVIFRKPLGKGPLTTVTGGTWDDLQPAVSPDGRRLAFSSNRDGAFRLYLRDQEGAAVRRLSPLEGEAFGPSWAPDSRRLAYFRTGKRGDAAWEIWITDVESGAQVDLGPGLFPAWSPAGLDGEWIAYQSSRGPCGGWFSLWKVRPDATHPTEIVSGESWGAVHPSWSPDARWIAFAAVGKSPEARRGGPGSIGRADDIYLVAEDGTHLTNLTGDRAGVAEWNPAFGPDGRVYFNSLEGGAVNVWSLDPGLALLRLDPEPHQPASRAEEAERTSASGDQAWTLSPGAGAAAGARPASSAR